MVLITPGITVMREKGAESHFVHNESFKTSLFDDLEVTTHIIRKKLLTGFSLWFYLYDFFRTRTGLLKQYGLKRYSEVLSNLALKKVIL